MDKKEPKQVIAYKFRIFPTRATEAYLFKTLELCRTLYNSAIIDRRITYEETKECPSYFDQCYKIAPMREKYPEYRTMDARVLYTTLHRAARTYDNFFRKQKELKKSGLPPVNEKGRLIGKPRLRKQGEFTTIQYEKSGWRIDQENKIITLTKNRDILGKVKVLMDRKIEGTIKTMAISRSLTNKWWVQFSVEDAPMIHAPITGQSVGVDFGVHTVVADSEGKTWGNPRFLRDFEDKIAYWQVKIAKLDRNDPKRSKYKRALCRVEEKLANKRQNLAREIAAHTTNNYDIICLEDVKVKEISKKAKTEEIQITRKVDQAKNRNTLDAGIGTIRQSIINAAGRRRGKITIKVKAAYTSQTCHVCGSRNSQMADLAERTFYCPQCHLRMDRDINAAKNILARGLDGLRSI